MVPTVPDAFCVKERDSDPTVFRIYADLFDDKAVLLLKTVSPTVMSFAFLDMGLPFYVD